MYHMTANYFAHNKKEAKSFDLALKCVLAVVLELRTDNSWHCKFARKSNLTSVNVVTILVM